MDQNPPTSEQPSLTLSDLIVLLNLVRVTTERGAIKADELTTVGAVYDKLVKFLEASGAINQVPQTDSPAETSAQ